MPRKKGIRNEWRRRTQCISWSTDEEKMVRYAMQQLWPVPFVGVRNDTGRSLFVHSATAFFFMFLQWAKENNVDVPVRFFEDLYGANFAVADKLIRLKQIYQGVVLSDKIKNDTGGTNGRGGIESPDSGTVSEGPHVADSGHEREQEDSEAVGGDDRPPDTLH